MTYDNWKTRNRNDEQMGDVEHMECRRDMRVEIERLRFALGSSVSWADEMKKRDEEIERLRAALIEIRDHWANQYDHPLKQSGVYRGSYGIGVTDGYRACAIIARRALE